MPGLTFVYAQMNHAIRKHDLNAIFIIGPGHGEPALVASTFLEAPTRSSTRSTATQRG